MLSERNETQKERYRVIPFIRHLKTAELQGGRTSQWYPGVRGRGRASLRKDGYQGMSWGFFWQPLCISNVVVVTGLYAFARTHITVTKSMNFIC